MLSPTQKLLRLQNDRSETSKSLALVKREVKLMENKPEVQRYNEYTQLKVLVKFNSIFMPLIK